VVLLVVLVVLLAVLALVYILVTWPFVRTNTNCFWRSTRNHKDDAIRRHTVHPAPHWHTTAASDNLQEIRSAPSHPRRGDSQWPGRRGRSFKERS
jgi:hypothetical protein